MGEIQDRECEKLARFDVVHEAPNRFVNHYHETGMFMHASKVMPELYRLRRELAEAQSELAPLRTYFGGSAPIHDLVADEVNRLRATLHEHEQQENTAIRWLTELRFALGDDGKRMLPELVEWAKGLQCELAEAKAALQDYGVARGLSDV